MEYGKYLTMLSITDYVTEYKFRNKILVAKKGGIHKQKNRILSQREIYAIYGISSVRDFNNLEGHRYAITTKNSKINRHIINLLQMQLEANKGGIIGVNLFMCLRCIQDMMEDNGWDDTIYVVLIK